MFASVVMALVMQLHSTNVIALHWHSMSSLGWFGMCVRGSLVHLLTVE